METSRPRPILEAKQVKEFLKGVSFVLGILTVGYCLLYMGLWTLVRILAK